MYREPGSVTGTFWVETVLPPPGPLEDVVDRLPGGGGLRARRVVAVDARLGTGRLDDQRRLAGVQPLRGRGLGLLAEEHRGNVPPHMAVRRLPIQTAALCARAPP